MIFYDFEVFSHDWLVVLYDTQTDEETRIHNDRERLEAFYNANIGEIWAGYNSKYYDRWILADIIGGWSASSEVIRHGDHPEMIKELSDDLVSHDAEGRRNAYYKTSKLQRCIKDFQNFDCMKPGGKSLKQLEAFAGVDIQETPIPFDLDRPLTDSELESVFRYCSHDVQQTRAAFDQTRRADYDAMMFFIEHYNLPKTDINLTPQQLTAKILGGNGKGRGPGFGDAEKFAIVDTLRLEKYIGVLKWRDSPEGRADNEPESPPVEICGIIHSFSEGGLHGAPERPARYDGLILHVDVTGCYPSLMARYGFGRRVIGDWQQFEFIHGSNLKYKKAGDKKARQPFKIIDNAISGQMKSQSSDLCDPRSNREICFNGQLLLLDLIEHIERAAGDFAELIQSNTDGVFYLVKNAEARQKISEAVKEWQSRTGLEAEETEINGVMYQKDVNNYIIFDRAGDVKKAIGTDMREPGPDNYNNVIIGKALRAYFGKGIKPEEVINAATDLRDFMCVVHATAKNPTIRHGETILQLKTVRAFASTDENAGGVRLFNTSKQTWGKAPGTPEHCFLDNGNIIGKQTPPELDREFYIDAAYKKIADWTGEIVRDSDASTKWGKKIQKGNTAQPKQASTKRKIPLETLMQPPIIKRPFNEYTPEEIAGAVFRALSKTEHSLKGMKWGRRTSDKWEARLKGVGDDRASERAKSLYIHMDAPQNAVLVDPRQTDSIVVWRWSIVNDESMKGVTGAITQEEVEAINRADRQKRAAKEAQEQAEAEAAEQVRRAIRAEYAEARPIADFTASDPAGGVQYLKQKRVFEYAVEVDKFLRITGRAPNAGALLVPYIVLNAKTITTGAGEFYAVQYIAPGFKGWPKGGTTGRGIGLHLIRGKSTAGIVLCEGLATGLSVHRRYGGRATVAVAGSAGDLEKAGRRLLTEYPRLKIIIAADNDPKGLTSAEKVRAIAPARVMVVKPE